MIHHLMRKTACCVTSFKVVIEMWWKDISLSLFSHSDSQQSEWVTSINISVNKRIVYNPWVLQPQLQKMSEQDAKHCWFLFGIHENNVFSGTKAIRLNILLSSLFIADLQSEYWMTGQSHIRGFNHVVMKGNLAHDKLLRGLKQEEWSCDGCLVPGLD